MNLQRQWSLGGGLVYDGASLPDDPRLQKAWDLPIVKKNWDNIYNMIRCLELD